jgi:flagellar biosynthetic protein FliS
MSDIATGAPDRETVLLYDAAIAALGEAIAAIAEDDIESRCAAVWVATEVITTLYLKLDIGRCGESADDLAGLYGHILGRAIGIILYNDPSTARDLIELLESLRDPRTTPNGIITASTLAARVHGTTLVPMPPAELESSS